MCPSSTLSKQLEEMGFKPVSVWTSEPLKSGNLTQHCERFQKWSVPVRRHHANDDL